MTQWNLSVRLSGQGSGLQRTLRDTAADARNASNEINALRRNLALLRSEAANNIRIRLDVDGDHLRSDVTTALNAASSGQDMRIRLDVDGNHLRDDVNASLAAAGAGQGIRARLDVDGDHLRDDVNAALTAAGAGQGLSVNLRLGNAMQLRREVDDAIRWATDGQRIRIPIGLADAMQLRRDVSAAVRWASMNQTITIRVDPDTSALNGLTQTLTGGAAAASSSSGPDWLKGLLLLAPAAIPLLAGISSNLAPLAGQFLATGGAATAFGIALAGQVGAMSEAAEAEKAYQDAVREHGVASAEAATAQLAYQQGLAQMPVDTQQAVIGLARLKDTFADWSDDMSGFTMDPVSKGFTVLEQLIPHLTPEVASFSGQLDRLMDVAGGAVSTSGFDAFSDRVAELTDAKLEDFTDDVIHLLRVLSEGGATDGAIGEILDYMRENGPAAREAVNAIGDAVSTLAQGAAQAGPTMLTLVTAAARLVSALPPEAVAVILQVATALKLLQLAGAGTAAVAAGVAALGTRIAALQAASAAAGGGMAGLAAAFATLGKAAKASIIVAGIGALVYTVSKLSDIGEKAPPNVDKLTTSLGKLGASGQVTGEAAKSFGKDFGELRDQIDRVTDPSVTESINNWGADVTNGLLDAGDATEEFNGSMKSIDEALTNLIKGGKAELAKAAIASMTEGMSPEQAAKFKEGLDGSTSALEDLKFEQDLTAASMGLFGDAVADTNAQLAAGQSAADGLRASILKLNEVNRSAYDAEIQFESAMDDLTEAFKKNGATLDIHTRAGQANGQAMSAAAKSQDEMIATSIAAGDSMATVTQKSSVLREQMMRLATDAFGGNKKAAEEYVNTLLGTPESVTTIIKAEREDAIRGLESVRAAVQATPDSHTVTVDTLNASAITALEAVGLKTRQLPDGKTEVYTANGQALGSIGAVSSALNTLDGKTANTYVNTFYTETHRTFRQGERDYTNKKADGGVLDFYADGGIRAYAGGGMSRGDRANQHVAEIAPAGSWRVWGEPETEGEGYVPFARSKRPRSRAITEEIVRRLGGDPLGIQWNADGGVTNWRYDPQTGSLYSASDAGQAGHKTKKVKIKGKIKEVEYFDVGAVEKKLKSAAKATQAWNKDLEKVADRVGGDVAEALAAMGEDGMKLADKMANGSTKYINDMAKALRDLQKVAKASLTDYTRQLDKANKVNKDFADDLAKLAAMGYGDLAAQLAAQGDEAAQQLADAAAKDPKKAKKANAEAKEANNALTSEQVSDLIQIIAAIKTSKTGIHDVAATTGLGEDEIIDVGNKAKAQIYKSLGNRADKFLADLMYANAGKAYADGGIRAGLYATRGGIIKFSEPETGGEGYIPLGANKRRHAMPVLADIARRFGVGLTDGQSARTVIIRDQAPLVGSSHFHIGDRRSDRDLARDIEARQSYQLRRLARGGAFAGSAGGSR